MKKTLIAILFTLLTAQAWAQTESFYTLENFSKGMKSHVSDYVIGEGEATEATNVRINDDYGTIAKRNHRISLAACHASPVKSLYHYYLSDNTDHTIATASTYLDAVDANGACTALYQTATDGKRWSFVTYKDLLIGMNGTDNAKKWDGSTSATADTDGHRTAGDLITDLGAPFAELNTGSNLSAAKWYQYKVAFFDTDTGIYTYSDARSNPILTGATVRDISLTDIPLGPTGVDQRIIYRTPGDASRAAVIVDSNIYRVATISNNTATTYNDTMSDATLVAASAPTWATVSAGTEVTPPKSKYALINQDRLFTANDPSGVQSGKSTVYWSEVLNPDYFLVDTNYDLIRPDDGDEITFIKNLLGTLTVGKTRTISKFYTSGSSSGWSISDPYSFIGCDAPWSAVNGISGIIYLGRYGIYNFGGQSSELISDTVTDRIRDILETNRDEVAGFYSDNTYHMAYTSAASGNANNDRVLVFDITRNSYVEDTSHIDSFTAADSGDDSGILYSGSSETDGSIYAYGSGFSNLIYRYKSQFEDGTIYRTYVGGEEGSPTLTLGSHDTWADSGTETWAGSGSATWLFDYQAGTWTSPIVQVNASAFDKLYWNESLGSYGNITWAVSTGDTVGGMSAFSSEYTDPSGSDISSIAGKIYVQLRASLSTTSWTETPTLFAADNYAVKMTYQKSGDAEEPDFNSVWSGGKTKLGSESAKRIKEIQVFYEGTAGTLTVSYTNEAGTENSFDIDLSKSPSFSTSDSYFGTNESKIFVHIPAFDNQPVGRLWKFSYSDEDAEGWKIQRVIVRFEVLPYVTYMRTL